MFSPEATVLSARSSLRNPRRRQRKDSDGLQHPRRKRSKLSEDVFHGPGDAHVNGNGSAIMKAHVGQDEADGSLVLVDMPVREKKITAKRALKSDTALYLTKNENYSLKRLPSTPSSLSQTSTPFRAFALPSAGLALATTTGHALVWDYTAPTEPSRALTLPLPFGLKPSDPLPLGAIVRNGPTNEFGIVVIAPSRGKIVFWENVDSAEARSQFSQHPQGVEGSVKMYSGEVITDLVDIEHAGYILVFSSGRIAQLTLRDSQGRPSITTNVLNTPNSSSGSFFSFKGFLGGAFRKSIASVKARPSESKGQMEVLSATKNGVIQVWDLSWSGQQMFKGEVDVHAAVLAAVQNETTPESRGQQEAHILDFAILEQQKTQGAIALLVLVALTGRESIEYSLLEVDLYQTQGIVSRAIPIRNFQQAQIPKEPTGVLLVPHPGHTAFVQFPGAIVVASLAEPEESPDTQLLTDSGKPTFPFQDAVYFRSDRPLSFCGSASETTHRKDKRSSAILFIQGCGAVQITALPPATDDDEIGRHKVTAKSKLEQATFFSTNPDNILDFSIQSRYTFGQEEVETAALAISTGILSSSYDHIDKATSSMDEQIKQRNLALSTLITHLQTEYLPISAVTRWHLLWNAEKLSAALALWNVYQETIQDQQARPEAYPESLILPHMVKCTHERFKTKIRPELGETDPVRQFFIKDINSLDILLPWAWQTLRTFYLNNESKGRAAIMQRLSEANDVINTTLEDAFAFRIANREEYGFDSRDFDFQLLKPDRGQDLLPNFWTSTHNIVASIRSLVDVGRNLACESFEKGMQEGLAMKIAQDNPRLVELSCKTHMERFTWALAQTDEKKQEMGTHLQQEWDKTVRPQQIYGLVEIGLANEGMALAEHYFDMPTLARLIWDETRYMEDTKESAQSKMEQAECIVKLNRIKERIHRYFDKYGNKWAQAFYSRYVNQNRTERLFSKEYIHQPTLTKFLRNSPALSRITWINDVSREKDYEAAHDALVKVATTQETNAWCKKVELSIAKLSLMCKEQNPAVTEQEKFAALKHDQKLTNAENRLEYVKIQDQIYEQLAPTISGALDDESAVDLLMAEFGQGRLADRPAHQQLLRQGFENLVNNRALEPALLIDILTLMTYEGPKEPTDILEYNEFAFALKALVLAWQDLNKTTRGNMLRLIWKRLCIKDNWAEINNTKDVSDDQLGDFLAHTSLGWTFKALLKMIAESSFYKVAWPGDLAGFLGAGCTNGELCVRFGSEDLRNPIIADNLADDEVLQANIEKHRLDQWFPAAAQAAKKLFEEEQAAEAAESVEFDGEDGGEEIGEDDEETAGLIEGSGAEGDQDVEMQDQ